MNQIARGVLPGPIGRTFRHVVGDARLANRAQALQPGEGLRIQCGIEPTPQPVGGGRFPIKYYLIAMLFIIFDIEIVFLYPWALTFNMLGLFGLVEMILFILTLLIAYLFVAAAARPEWE